eukprot:scaffold865_cov65-Phaeocystis_antarctica.AAC.6
MRSFRSQPFDSPPSVPLPPCAPSPPSPPQGKPCSEVLSVRSPCAVRCREDSAVMTTHRASVKAD